MRSNRCLAQSLAQSSLGLVHWLSLGQPGSQVDALGSQQVADTRRPWRQFRGTRVSSEWRDSGLAETAGFDGNLHAFPLNDENRRTTRAARPLTPVLFDKLRAVDQSHWRQAGADLGGTVHRLMAAGWSITL
jgi:hypothetical protein